MTWLRSNWERFLGALCLGAGVVATVVAYFGVHSSPYLAEKLSYIISGGVGGLLLIGVGAMLLVTGHLHIMRQDLLRAAEKVRSSRRGVDVTLPGAEESSDDAASSERGSDPPDPSAMPAAPVPVSISGV